MNRAGYTSVRQATNDAGSVQECRRFRVVSVSGDWLVCRTWDGTRQGADDVFVAKSWLLRRTPFDGASWNGLSYVYASDVERVADDGSQTETQVVVPPYVVGDEVWATQRPRGGTGVEGAPYWLDDNRDGRAWAKRGQ